MDLSSVEPSCTRRGVLIEEEAVGVGFFAVWQGDDGEVGVFAGFQRADFCIAAEGFGAGQGAEAQRRGWG